MTIVNIHNFGSYVEGECQDSKDQKRKKDQKSNKEVQKENKLNDKA